MNDDIFPMRDDFFHADEKYDALTTDQLREALEKGGLVTRVHALAALARRSRRDQEALLLAINAVTDPRNSTARLLGYTVSHFGIACLWAFGPPVGREAIRHLLATWPEPDRSDLLYFMEGQDLPIDELQTVTPS